MNHTTTVRLLGKIRAMSGNDVMAHIGEDRYRAIKARDAHPQFIGMLVAYEGPSTGQLLGDFSEFERELQPIKWWEEDAVYELAYRINIDGPKLVLGHDNPDRRNEGDVLSGWVEQAAAGAAGGTRIPHCYAVAYVTNEESRQNILDGTLDVVSVEADLLLGIDPQSGHVQVESVTLCEAIALGNSREMPPGFQRASVDAVVQEFQTGHTATSHNGDSTMDPKDPTKLTRNELLELPLVDELIRERNKQVYDDYKTERDAADSLRREKTDLQGRITSLETRLKDVGGVANKPRIQKLVADQVAAAKIPKKLKTDVLAKLEDLEIADPEISDDDLAGQVKTAVDRELAFAERLATTYDIKDDEGDDGEGGDAGKGDGGDDNKAPGADTDNAQGSGDEDDFVKNNPIPEDK